MARMRTIYGDVLGTTKLAPIVAPAGMNEYRAKGDVAGSPDGHMRPYDYIDTLVGEHEPWTACRVIKS